MFFIHKNRVRDNTLYSSEKPSKPKWPLGFSVMFFAFVCILIYASNPDPVKSPNRERFEEILERAEQGHIFTPEEESELCSLWQVFYGEELLGEDCERLIRKIQKQDLDSFKVAIRPCLEELKAVYGGEITDTQFKDGLQLQFDTAATTIIIRLMHKSSGGHQYKSSKSKFRIQSEKYHLGENGVQTSNKKSHFYFDDCPEVLIKSIIEKHIKWRRHKGKHLKR